MALMCLVLLGLLWTASSSANPACVVCTVAIGASLSIAHTLGVSDCVVGVWAGAMLAILGYWTIRFCDKHGWRFLGRDMLLMGLSVASIGFMYVKTLTYRPIIIGFLYIDAFLLAALTGALAFILSMRFYQFLKEKNGGHAHFPFEKVVLPFVVVLLVSWIFHATDICNCTSL